jgi:hypothetical protein
MRESPDRADAEITPSHGRKIAEFILYNSFEWSVLMGNFPGLLARSSDRENYNQ